jgi:cobalt/nickel transport system permease protein
VKAIVAFQTHEPGDRPEAARIGMARTCRSTGAVIARRATVPFTPLPLLAVAVATASVPLPARAMHLADGTLPAAWTGVWWALAVAGLALALGRLRARATRDALAAPLTGTMAALILVLSSIPIPVPVAGSSGHACGTGLAAILIGPWLTLLACFVTLLLQALIEGHGGLTTLGANTVSMGLAGGFVAWAAFRLARRAGVGLPTAGALAGVGANVATYGAAAMQLALAHHGPASLAHAAAGIETAFLPVQLPIAILEGALSAGALRLLAARRPDLLVRLGVLASAQEQA